VGVNYPDPIESFVGDVTTVISGEAVELSWQTNLATSVSLCVEGGACLDLSGLSLESDSIVVRPQVTTNYVLTVTNPGGTGSLSVEIEVVAAPLQITEIYYSAPGNDGSLQWVEITNRGDTFVDLANYAIGSGSDDYTATTMQLSGILAPGGCYVTTAAFAPAIAAPPVAPSTGVGLFFAQAADIDGQSLPIDAVVFGSANAQGLLGPDGATVTALSAETVEGESLIRVSESSSAFQIETSPSPGQCFHVANYSPAGGFNDEDVTLTIEGYGFDLARDVVSMSEIGELVCVEITDGLQCTIPATTYEGLVDLIVSRQAAYVEGSNGDPVRQSLDPQHWVDYVIADAYEFVSAGP
jgi:hypothetical protein